MDPNMMHSKFIDHCLTSGNPVVKILDLGQHAYADTFIRPDQLNLSEPVFPLHVYMNSTSGQIQLGYVSNAQDRYNLYSYSYTSSNSTFARAHWDNYAHAIKKQFNPKGLVVEIGSNDGYLVKQFQQDDIRVLGIDSSESMCQIATEQGVTCVNEVFTQEVAQQVLAKYGKASLVIANNVFNHANDPVNFANGVRELLAPNGVFVFELPYWADTVQSGRWDQIYHEHISYFTIKSSWHLLARAGMHMIDFEHVDYHGGSIRVMAMLGSTDQIPAHIQSVIDQETQQGLFDPTRYVQMQHDMIKHRDQWLENFYKIRINEPDAVIIGVGAAAKANTWLTWHHLDYSVLHCITDSSSHKQGKFTPLSRIPIHGDEEFAKYDQPYALILSWNISAGLKSALLNINPTIRFLTQ